MLVVLALLLFIGLVLVHEWGHYLVARRNNVEVEEFGLGFPPRIKKLGKRKGTQFTLNWLPLGGFVKLKGEHDADTEPGSFGAAGLWAKSKIMLAGVAMNLVVAFVMLTALAAIGIPKLIDNQYTVASDTKVTKQEVLVGAVESGSPAAKAGIQVQDELAAIGLPDQPKIYITSEGQLPKLTKFFAGRTVELIVRRGDIASQKTITLRTDQQAQGGKGNLGISPTEYTLRRSTWSAPIVGAGLVKQFTVLTVKGLGSAIGNLVQGHGKAAGSQVGGPITIFYVIKDGSFLGFQFVLMFIAIISLTLAIMNVLPLPPLDGGRFFILVGSRVLNKPLTIEQEERLVGWGSALLGILIVLVFIVDIHRWIFK